MKNQLVAEIFRTIADILEVKQENPFRVRAYRRAADTVEGLSGAIEQYVAEGRLDQIPGIGKDLSQKIAEICATDSLAYLDQLEKSIPEGLLSLLDIPSVGPKTVHLLYARLGIENIESLKNAIQSEKLLGLPGIKEKTISNIQHGIAVLEASKERMPFARALELAQELSRALSKNKDIKQLEFGGSLRRCKETVRDIDVLVVSKKPRIVMDVFTRLPLAAQVQAHGPSKSSIRTRDNIQVDCRVVDESSFGAALLYFTGSKNFNIRMRQLAQKNGWKINEYGVFADTDKAGKRPLAGRTEEQIFKLFKMQFVPPELREDTGEIELALKNKLATIVTRADIRGDLHVHSSYSDGINTIEEMARAARRLGHGYVAITDHSQSLKIASGLSLPELKRKKQEIEKLNRKFKDFRILYGTEVDIDSDGKIDYPDRVLREFDIVVAAIHTGFKQSREQLTRRLLGACANKHVHIIAHPTGRLWGTRAAYDLDLEAVFAACRDTNTALEINSFPQRLDLNDQHCRYAKAKGAKIAINTDSHAIEHLDNIGLGLAVARRGWLEPADVLNTLPLSKLLKTIKK